MSERNTKPEFPPALEEVGIAQRFTDNGLLSHYQLTDKRTGEVLCCQEETDNLKEELNRVKIEKAAWYKKLYSKLQRLMNDDSFHIWDYAKEVSEKIDSLTSSNKGESND